MRTPMAVLLLLTQTANAQQGPRNSANAPLTRPQFGGHAMSSLRYPVRPASYQRDSYGPPAEGDQMPQNYSVQNPAMLPQFWPPPVTSGQPQLLPPQMMLPPQNNSVEPKVLPQWPVPAADLGWSFNFQQAPWPIVLRTFAREAGFSLQMNVDPEGDFTYFDENQYSVTEALDVFNDNLMTMGQILVRDGNRLTLLNATSNIPGNIIPFVPIHGIDSLGRNELATVAIPLRNTDPMQAIEEIRELQSPLGQVKALTNSGRVIVTDTGSYLRRMRDLLLGSGVGAGDGQAYVYQLRHAQAEEVAKAITDFLSRNGGGVGGAGAEGNFSNNSSDSNQRVVAEKTTNSLLIRGTTDEMGTIQRIIEDLDRAPREVLVQALLVEVELGNTNELGVELGFQDSVLFDRSVVDKLVTISQTTTAPNGTQTTNQNIISQTAAPGFNFNNQPLGNNVASRPSHLAGQSLSSFGVGRVNGDLGFGGLVLSAGSESVNLLLRALDAQFHVDVLSRPQVRAVENHQAFIQIGQQVPVVDGVSITPVGTANPVIRQDQAGIILKVTPRISPDGRVQLQVNAEKSSFNLTPGTGVPIFTDATNGNVIEAPIKDITTADTTVSIQSGQTIVLGGMITNDEATVTRKVPWLGDIPFIGRLFRYDLHRHKRKELLVFLTPIVLENDGHNEYLKSKETGLMNMPSQAFSFGDNLTGHYDNSTNGVAVPASSQMFDPADSSDYSGNVQQMSYQATGGRHSFQNGNTVDESDSVRGAGYEVVEEEPAKRRRKWGVPGFLNRKKPDQELKSPGPTSLKPTPPPYSRPPNPGPPSNRYR